MRKRMNQLLSLFLALSLLCSGPAQAAAWGADLGEPMDTQSASAEEDALWTEADADEATDAASESSEADPPEDESLSYADSDADQSAEAQDADSDVSQNNEAEVSDEASADASEPESAEASQSDEEQAAESDERAEAQDAAPAEAPDASTPADDAPPAEHRKVRSAEQMADFLSQQWRDDYFQEAVVDTKKDRVSVDGQQVQPEEVFGPEADAEELLDSPAAAEAYFEDTPFEAEVERDGKVHVTAPWQSRRIVVTASSLDGDYGAETVVEFPKYHQFVLQFADDAATQAAYEALSGRYECFVDEILFADDLLQATDSETWGESFMGFDSTTLSSMTLPTETVKVAIIDSGCDKTNPFFGERRFSNASKSFVDNGSPYDDALSNSHGTHVAGIVHACTPGNVELMILRIYKETTTSLYIANEAVLYAIENGAEVVNFSSALTSATASLNKSMNSSLSKSREAAVPVVCAAGNTSQDVARSYPACHENAIAVSSLHPCGEFAATYPDLSRLNSGAITVDGLDQPNWSKVGQYVSGSAYGSAIDFCAPGAAVYSSIKGGMQYKNGTSMAAPFITAAYAWLKLVDPTADWDTLYQRLSDMCTDLGDEGWDQYYGWGCPDLQYLDPTVSEHIWSSVVVPPTCTSEGYTEHTCSHCDRVRKTDYVGPSHDIVNGVCTLCGKTLNESCGSGVTWSYESTTETLTVTAGSSGGTVDTASWENLYPQKFIRRLELRGVTAVGTEMFRDYTRLSSVDFGTKLETLHENAFSGCTSLRTVSLPSSLKSAEDGVLTDCTALLSLSGSGLVSDGFLFSSSEQKRIVACAQAGLGNTFTVPEGVTALAPRCFSPASSLVQLILPTTLETLESSCCADCQNLAEIYARSNVVTLGEDAFENVEATVYVSVGCTGWETPNALGGNLSWDSYPGNLADETQWTMSLNSDTWDYTGEGRKPGSLLVHGTPGDADYKEFHNYKKGEESANHSGVFTFSYTNNTALGLATDQNPPTATVKGTGIYYGKRSLPFNIRLKTPASPTVTALPRGLLVEWESVKGAQWYRLKRKVDGGEWENVSGSETQNLSYTDTSVESGHSYCYGVLCYTEEYKTDPVARYISKYKKGEQNVFFLPAPVLKSAQLQDDGTVLVAWEASEQAERYQLLRQTGDADEPWELVLETDRTSAADPQPKSGENVYTVRAVAENGALSGVYAGISARYLATPELQSLQCEAQGMRLQWKKDPNAPLYRVYCKVDGGGWKVVTDTTQTSLLLTTSDGRTALRNGVAYTFTVRCVTKDGSSVSLFNPDGLRQVCCAGPVLRTPAVTQNGLQLEWGSDSKAQRYVVLRQDAQGNWQELARPNALRYTDPKPLAGQVNIYRIRYQTADGSLSGWQADVGAFWCAAPVLTDASVEGNALRLRWNASAGASGYRVYQSIASGSWTAVGDTSSTTLLLTALRSGTSYRFAVACLDGSGTVVSAQSAPLERQYLSMPVMKSAAREGTGIRLRWNGSTGAAKYRVFCRVGSGGWKKVSDTASTTALVRTSNGTAALVTGRTYTFTVRCVSADGKNYTSDYNRTGKSIVFVCAPTLSSLKNSKAGVITARWKSVKGVTGYQVQLARNAKFTSGKKTLKLTGANKVSGSFSKLKKKTVYWVRVRAWRKVGGKNQWSTWSSAKKLTVKK